MTGLSFRDGQEFMTYINNPANYKQTRKKQYQIWACMPEVGTKVFNKLEQAAYTTDESHRFVLSGTRGEQWVVAVEKLAKTYILATGAEITKESLTQLQIKAGGGCIDWFKIATKGDSSGYFACFVPADIPFQIPTAWGTVLNGNVHGVLHGKGDFIVCPAVNGQPNLNDRWIVNGAVFVDTYDNRGFADCLVSNPNAGEAPKPNTLITGVSSQEGVVIAQKAAREITGRLKQVGSAVPSNIAQKCSVNIPDFKYDCKAEQVSLDSGKKLLSDCISDITDGVYFAGASVSRLNPTVWSNEIRFKRNEFLASLHAVTCFDVIEMIECQTLGLDFKQHKMRCLIVMDSARKYYCLVNPALRGLDFIIAALDGTLKKPLADELFSREYSWAWLKIASVKAIALLLRNMPTITKPMLSQLINPIEGIELAKKPVERFNYRGKLVTPNALFEIHGSGSTRNNIYGYCAVFETMPSQKTAGCIFFSRDKNSVVDDCFTHLLTCNIYDLSKSLSFFIEHFIRGFQKCLGETHSERDMKAFKDSFRRGPSLSSIFKLYADAARSKSIFRAKKLPATICSSEDTIGSGIPLKDVPIENLIIPSEELRVNPMDAGEMVYSNFECYVVLLLVSALLISYYERNPRKFLLGDEHSNIRVCGSIEGCYFEMYGAHARFQFDYSLIRWEGDECLGRVSFPVNFATIHKKYFRTGKTLSQVASACFANEKDLALLKEYVIKTMDYGQ